MTSLSSLAVAVFAVIAAALGSAADHWYGSALNRSRIHLAGLIPLTSYDTGDDWGERVDKPAPDVLQAVLMALDDVNHNRRILRDYQLHLDWKDTKVRYVIHQGQAPIFSRSYSSSSSLTRSRQGP